MKKTTTTAVVVGVILIAAAIAAGFLMGRATGSGDGSAVGGSATAADSKPGDREVLYWRAPMDPNEIYDRPGKSRMGMDLVPVYAAETSGDSAVRIDSGTLQNIGVRTARVVNEPLQRTVRTTGRFEMDERGAHAVTLKVGGWVESLHVDYEGALVRTGDPLLELYSPDLVSTQEEYLLALRNVEKFRGTPAAADADRLLAAARRRLAFWDLSDDQIRSIGETGEPQRTMTFFAPATGEVMNKRVVQGQQIRPGERLLDIMDISKVWLIVDVFEQDLAWVRVGTQAQIELPYAPGRTYTGRVEHIYFMVDMDTRAAKARIILPTGSRPKLKPGMYATVTLVGAATTPTPVVPEEALIRSGDEELVVVSLGDGRFEPMRVETGMQAGGKIQILEGLSEGQEIVTSAQFLIDSEAQLQSAIRSLTSGSKAIDRQNPGGATRGGRDTDPVDGMEDHDMNEMEGHDMDQAKGAADGSGAADHSSKNHKM